jgi:hypothetical protein
MGVWKPEGEVVRAAEIKGIEVRADQKHMNSTDLRADVWETTRRRWSCTVRRVVAFVAVLAIVVFAIIMLW